METTKIKQLKNTAWIVKFIDENGKAYVRFVSNSVVSKWEKKMRVSKYENTKINGFVVRETEKALLINCKIVSALVPIDTPLEKSTIEKDIWFPKSVITINDNELYVKKSFTNFNFKHANKILVFAK